MLAKGLENYHPNYGVLSVTISTLLTSEQLSLAIENRPVGFCPLVMILPFLDALFARIGGAMSWHIFEIVRRIACERSGPNDAAGGCLREGELEKQDSRDSQ